VAPPEGPTRRQPAASSRWPDLTHWPDLARLADPTSWADPARLADVARLADPARWAELADPRTWSPRRVVLDIAGQLADRLAGHPITLAVRDASARVILDSLQIVDDGQAAWSHLSPDVLEAVRIELREVRIELREVHLERGHAFNRVSLVARRVRVEPRPGPELVTDAIDIVATASREEMARLLEASRPGLRVRPLDRGRVEVRLPGRRTSFVAVPRFERGRVQVDVEAVALGAVEVPLPKAARRRIAERLDLPAPRLAPGLELVEAEQHETTVTLGLRHRGIREPIRVEHLVGLLRRGVSELSLVPRAHR